MKKTEKLDITKQKLKDAAQKLMEDCNNHSEVTSRAISNEAGVPVAMINYCFGSRENLLFEVFSSKSDEYKNDPRIKQITAADMSPKEKLRQMYYTVAEFLVAHYKFSSAVTKYVLLNRDLSKGLNSLPYVIEHYNGRKSEQDCKIIAYELSSMMQLAIYRYKELAEFSGYDFTDKEQLHRFVDLQIDLLLGELKN